MASFVIPTARSDCSGFCATISHGLAVVRFVWCMGRFCPMSILRGGLLQARMGALKDSF